jgi:hypothetical protein
MVPSPGDAHHGNPGCGPPAPPLSLEEQRQLFDHLMAMFNADL